MKRKKRDDRGILVRKALAVGGLMSFLLCCPHSSSAPKFESPVGLTKNFFSQALNDTDFDARDSKNRPMRFQKARAQMKDLFAATVIQLLAVQNLPIVSTSGDILKKIMSPIRHFLAKARGVMRHAVEIAALLNFKRIVEKLKFLNATFGFVLAAGLLGLRLRSRAFFVDNLSPQLLPLRC